MINLLNIDNLYVCVDCLTISSQKEPSIHIELSGWLCLDQLIYLSLNILQTLNSGGAVVLK